MKQITIDLDAYNKVKDEIDLEQFLILYCKYYNKLEYIQIVTDESELVDLLVGLETDHYIKITEEMFIIIEGYRELNLQCFELRAKANELFESKKRDLETLANQMREIFPPKIRGGGGTPVRSSTKEVIEKLKKFFKYYPEYTEEEVIKATINYIENRRKANWAYITQLDYFIFKDSKSILAAEIEYSEEDEEINPFDREA
jgi:hypothetical protein